MSKLLKNKKGLTLVELLAVVVILGVVAAIAVPAIGKTIENSKIRADIGTLNLIRDAAIRWSLDEQTAGNSGTTTAATNISALQTSGHLTSFTAVAQSDADVTFSTFTVSISGGVITVSVLDASSDPITEATFTG